MRATATTLAPGSAATANYSNGLLSLGIPRGDKGETGDTGARGETGATPNLSIGTVTTLPPTGSSAVTITGTAENPVLNFDLVKGDTGEVSQAELDEAVTDLKSEIISIYPTDSADGDIASFADGADDVPMESLKVNIKFVQEGSDTPSPTNVRPISGWTEVNTYDDPIYGGIVNFNQRAYTTASSSTNYGVTFTNNGDGSWTLTGSGTGTYGKLITTLNPAMTIGHVVWLTSGADIDGTDSTFYTCLTRQGTSMVRAYPTFGRIHRVAATYNEFSIRTFSGFVAPEDGLVLKPMLVDITQMFGEEVAEYVYNLEVANDGAGIAYIRKVLFKDYYPYNLGEQMTASELNGIPYNHYTTSLGQTVYGGTLDVVTGELVIDWMMNTFDGSSVTQIGTAGGIKYARVLASNSRPQDGSWTYCDVYHTVSSANAHDLSIVWVSYGQKVVRIFDNRFTDLATAKAILDEQPAHLVYKMAYPQTVQLTPTEVKSLLGTNNVWADAGSVDVIYRADVGLYVDKEKEAVRAEYDGMIAPTEETYTATRNYTTGSLLIVDGTLYKATANIANGASIVPNTNVVSTTLSEVISALA